MRRLFLVSITVFAATVASLADIAPYRPRQGTVEDAEICKKQSGDIAIAACSRAIASSRYTGNSLAILYGDRGVEYSKKGDYDRAIADYDQAIQIDPKYAVAYNNRGIAWRVKGDYNRAIADYDQAILTNPKYVAAYSNRGNAWRLKGDYDRAIADLDQAIQLDPKFANAYYNRGLAWESKHELQKALTNFMKYSELAPSDSDGPKAIERVKNTMRAGN